MIVTCKCNCKDTLLYYDLYYDTMSSHCLPLLNSVAPHLISPIFSTEDIFKEVEEIRKAEDLKRLELLNKAKEIVERNKESFTRLMASSIAHGKDTANLILTMSGKCGAFDIGDDELADAAKKILEIELAKLGLTLEGRDKDTVSGLKVLKYMRENSKATQAQN